MKPAISVIGCGASGSLIAQKIARLEVSLKVIDRDFVDESNLGVFYQRKDLGKPKPFAMEKHIREAEKIRIKAISGDLNAKNIDFYLKNSDLIIDCTDNMHTRYLLNDFCIKNKIPFIYGGVTASEGMSAVFSGDGKPCFRCLFQKIPKPGSIETCETRGVSLPAVRKVVNYQFLYATGLLKNENADFGRLFYFDLKNRIQAVSKIKPNGKCPVCAKNEFDFLEGRFESGFLELCGRNSWHINPAKKYDLDLRKIKSRFSGSKRHEITAIGNMILHIKTKNNSVSIFPDGRAIIKARNNEMHASHESVSISENEAKSLYSRIIGN